MAFSPNPAISMTEMATSVIRKAHVPSARRASKIPALCKRKALKTRK